MQHPNTALGVRRSKVPAVELAVAHEHRGPDLRRILRDMCDGCIIEQSRRQSVDEQKRRQAAENAEARRVD